MVQTRKAQQGDALEKKQGAILSRKLSSSSLTSKKKQYTVPHPLSGKWTYIETIIEFVVMHDACSNSLLTFGWMLSSLEVVLHHFSVLVQM